MDGAAGTIEALLERMGTLLAPMEADDDPRRHFLATYRRTTVAVHKALLAGHFLDAAWVERWDVVFAGLYLDALEQWNHGEQPPGPWAVAFESAADRRVPPLRHVLLGMNAHINYDLPQALLAAITDEEFADPAVVKRRGIDHERIDAILASRVDAEDVELQRVEKPGDRTRLDRMLKPFNQAATKRFMTESRRKVWRNALALSEARRDGSAALAARLVELEDLSRRRIEDLRVPGQVLIKLAVRGFGVELPPTSPREG
ncbi:MAG TPA: DUF5995 family protein [Ilumatobacteraceae bacterium]|nr:DUF5995 family protein [Ilumatobacteraceae bacterium]